ncbi:hypothetical protein ICN19_03145 [Polynucleobacter sp. AP-Capit-er-40B-B4]|uniref:type II toxin-antitoxin system PemK/MazF family toxin n=1 Tax=Polynucleobacter sp. AP-Capit-er-40B-B4 TaxID=2576927 RepID=UPI001C0B181A|nr:type II toxin-antitoxin system PemK/MazF family toxin [Polynucleobacter sp. AP-Capit-er-40B-B4]MBU3581010.1 hypothetical protein [Polynucleobacter sp. AP-Capit-er-40B-B4]
MRWWLEPVAGEIVWCHFPDNIQPKPKARPALILSCLESDDGNFFANVAYGTSKKVDRLYKGEFLIAKHQNPVAYDVAGLSYDTKFDLGNAIELPFNDRYFAVPPHAPFGHTPKMGILHPSMVKAASAAFKAIRAK